MNELIFIERTGYKIIVEKLMLGDTVDDFPNLFTYFYISTYRPNKLDISIWRKNSNINENDLTNNSKYIIVMKYKDGQYGFTSILKGKTVKHYIKWIINKLKKKKVVWYGIYDIKDGLYTDELMNKYSDRVNISISEINSMD